MATITLNGLKFTAGEKIKETHIELIKDFIEHVSFVKNNYSSLEKAVEKNKEETTEQFNKMQKSTKELKSKLSASVVESQTLNKRLEDKIKELEASRSYSVVVQDLLNLRKEMQTGREDISKATNNIRSYNQTIQKLVKETEELLKNVDDDDDFCRTEVAEEHTFNFQQKANKLNEQTKLISQCQKENDKISEIKNSIASRINDFQDKTELHQNVYQFSTELLQWKLLRTKKEIKDSILENKSSKAKEESESYDFDKTPTPALPLPAPIPVLLPVTTTTLPATTSLQAALEMNFGYEHRKEIKMDLPDSDNEEDEDSSSDEEQNIFAKMSKNDDSDDDFRIRSDSGSESD